MPGVQAGHSWEAEGLNEVGEDVRPPLTEISEAMDYEYVVKTDLDISYVKQIAVEIFKQWTAFALGAATAGGKVLMHPTGAYASTLDWKQTGEATVAIVADPAVDNVAYLLEAGHGQVDLKTPAGFRQGRIFHSAMWAYPSKRFPGGGPDFVQVGAAGWVVPPMPAYSPAKTFAMLAAQLAQEA